MAQSNQVSKRLTKTIDDLLKEVGEKAPDDSGKMVFKHSLTDRCKVLDRALKLEAIKLKQVDGDYGSGFNDDPDPDKDD